MLRPLTRFREMRFPSFPANLHDRIVYSDDYFRYATLGLAIQRVLDEPIEGAFAEVGVWRGRRAPSCIAPRRRGGSTSSTRSRASRISDLGPGEVDTRFRDTSQEAVRRRVGPSTNVILRPGYVPDTLAGLEDERFAFVLSTSISSSPPWRASSSSTSAWRRAATS